MFCSLCFDDCCFLVVFVHHLCQTDVVFPFDPQCFSEVVGSFAFTVTVHIVIIMIVLYSEYSLKV